jgi:tetratricopeptide (TPR) repeat protein
LVSEVLVTDKGQVDREGASQKAGLAWAAILLVLFFTVIRTLGDWTRPTAAALDCDHFAPGDKTARERCVELRPDDVELMMELGGAYEEAAQWDRAEAMYRRALAIDPEDGDARVRLGGLLLRRGDMTAGRQQGVAALAIQPGRVAAGDLVRRAGQPGSDR